MPTGKHLTQHLSTIIYKVRSEDEESHNFFFLIWRFVKWRNKNNFLKKSKNSACAVIYTKITVQEKQQQKKNCHFFFLL